jgi:hypothetical protein
MFESTMRTIYRSCIGIIVTVCIASPLSGQRMCCEGDMWLKWSELEKDLFVNGYVAGYVSGLGSGCRTGIGTSSDQKGIENERRIDTCSRDVADFYKGTPYLSKRITEFYIRYPEDRELDPNEILDLVGRGLTPEQIHHHPFPRHTEPLSKP